MATWREVIQDENYKKLSIFEKSKTKNEFFKYKISQSPKFKTLSSEKQKNVEKDFFAIRKEEGLEPDYGEKPSLGSVLKLTAKEFRSTPMATTIDKPVEEVAKWIEPDKVKPGFLGGAEFFARQGIAEVARAYKPSVAVPFALGAKAIKPLAKLAGKAITKITPQVVKKALKPVGKFLTKELTVGKGRPKAYQALTREAELEKAIGGREAEKAAKVLTTKPTGKVLSKEEQKYVGRIFRKEVIESPALKAHPKYQELKAISDEGRVIMDKWSNELAKSGLLKKETAKIIEDNIGSYMARQYTSKLKKPVGLFGSLKDFRLRLGGIKHRKDLSEEVRKLMGEIKEPALPTAIRVKEISSSIANNKVFSAVAKNPEWVANTNLTGKLIKMPDTPAVGALRNKWVIPEIAQDINAIAKIGEQTQGIYLKALSAWKFGKVVLNPAAQTRNMLSNTILLDLSGTNHLRQAKLFPKAFKNYLSKGKLYQQALDDGAIGGEFVGTETMQKLKSVYESTAESNLQKWMNVAKTPFKKAGELYQGMEQLAKMVKYMDVIEKTGSRKLAASEAQKWLFDYNKIPNFISLVRKSPIGAPFITFTYKAIPRIAETLINRPMALYKYKAMAEAFNETSRKYQGKSPVEFAREKGALPKWVLRDIGGMPTNLLLPWKDKHGRTQWLNLEYILPVGQAPEIAEKGLGGIVSNPAFNITSDIIKNLDFKGTKIIPPEATKKEAAAAIAKYIYRQLAPSLAPGGYSAEKIRAGVAGEPERFNPERTREAIPALLDTMVGLKINPVDVDQADMFKLFDKKKRIKELDKEFYTIYNNPILSEEKKEKMIDNIFNKKMKVINE